MAWLYLIGAGLLEMVWATSLKAAHGLTRLGPSLVAFGSAGLSFFLLSLALRDLPAGTAYAVFVGIGAVGMAFVGIAFLGEPASLARVGGIVLVVVGIVALRLAEAG